MRESLGSKGELTSFRKKRLKQILWQILCLENLLGVEFIFQSKNSNRVLKKGEVIVKLKNRDITAPFTGVIGKRNFSEDLEVSTTSILINFEDSSTIYSDVNIPEIFAPFIKIGLNVDVWRCLLFWRHAMQSPVGMQAEWNLMQFLEHFLRLGNSWAMYVDSPIGARRPASHSTHMGKAL